MANSTKMGTIGNNLANVNTYGFKGARTDFMDLMSANVGTAAGVKQIGRGVRVGTVVSDYSQGGLETTSENLDMAISGNGFFMVKQKSQIGSNGKMLNTGNTTTYYSRAGDFSFDSDGYLVSPQGQAVQGWKVDQNRIDAANAAGTVLSQTPVTGDIQDIRLTQFTSPAKATSNVTMITQLDSDTKSQNTRVAGTNYYSAMTQQWNGSKSPAMPSTAYGYQSTVKVYDENGSPHTLSVYYDKIASSDGKDYWEYCVTCDPSEDGRVDASGVPFSGTATAGMLMTGTMTFDSSGSLQNMSAYTMLSNASPGGTFDNTVWSAAKVENGYPVFTANFKSVSDASFTGQTNALNIALNIGIANKTGFQPGATGSTLADADATGLPVDLVSFNPATTTVNSSVTTSYATSSSTVFSSQNGYTSGLLTSVSVNRDGILTGTFSNGQTQQLWALALANFTNLQGLSRQGSNLYAATLESGQGTTNRANTGSVGSISGNTLETSNVDLATEMVSMILTQRGFEANSKTITTVDSMLSEVIQLKR
jgi:flagellar hook protein FlgE